MGGIAGWARDVLVSRGALVETEDDSSLRAMLPPEVAEVLESTDWLSLRFGAGAGSDDETDWLERLGRLLPPDPHVTGARLRYPAMVRPMDAAAVLDRELVIQNGIYRQPEDAQSTARYYFFSFEYTVESDETSTGLWTVCLNASARSLVSQAESLLNSLRDDLEDDPSFVLPQEELARLFPVAVAWVQPEVRQQAVAMESNANRRLARDAERIDHYYRDMLRQIERRIARHKGDEEAANRERSRAAVTELDRAAKLDDLMRKYSLKIRIQPGDILVLPLPVREITVKVIRKKAERIAKFHWNPVLGGLESPWCEACSGRAHPLYLCDDRVHFLCRSCQAACESCGRSFCRACQKRCKCGALGIAARAGSSA
jgi:hypothetical protein